MNSVYQIKDEWPDIWPAVRRLYALYNQTASKNKKLKLLIVDQPFYWPSLKSDEILITTNWFPPAEFPRSDQIKILPDSFWGAAYARGPSYDASLEPCYSYNCFINRMDAMRQSWLYLLLRRNIFDQGLISFNMDVSRHLVSGNFAKNATASDIFDIQFEQSFKNFQPEHEYIRSKVPYKNFADSNLSNVIMQSKFSLVLETYFADNRSISHSEKIFRCLKLPRPWIVFSMKGTVYHLRSMGFDLLDDIVDHSYDNIDDSIQRQSLVLDQVEQLIKIKYNDVLQQRLVQSAKHNQQLLDQFRQSFETDCIKFFNELKC